MKGCLCPECFGLHEYMFRLTGKEYGLEASGGHAWEGLEDLCDGSLVCDCKACSEERLQRVSRPRKQIKQPWE